MITKVINPVTGQEGTMIRRTKKGITVDFGPNSWGTVELPFRKIYLNMYAQVYMIRG